MAVPRSSQEQGHPGGSQRARGGRDLNSGSLLAASYERPRRVSMIGIPQALSPEGGCRSSGRVRDMMGRKGPGSG
jgi:hypothetical protein